MRGEPTKNYSGNMTGVNLDCPRQIGNVVHGMKVTDLPWSAPLISILPSWIHSSSHPTVSNPGVTEEVDLRSREFAEESTVPEDRRPREVMRFSLNLGSTC